MIKRRFVNTDAIKGSTIISSFHKPYMNHDVDPHALKLAKEIAYTLNDMDSLALHIQYAQRYQEAFLRKTLAKVMSIDERKIKRSRAALYTFLINQHSRSNDAGH